MNSGGTEGCALEETMHHIVRRVCTQYRVQALCLGYFASVSCNTNCRTHRAQEALGAAQRGRRVLRVAHLHARQRQREAVLRAGGHQGLVAIAAVAVPVPRRRLGRVAARVPPPVQPRHLKIGSKCKVSSANMYWCF